MANLVYILHIGSHEIPYDSLSCMFGLPCAAAGPRARLPAAGGHPGNRQELYPAAAPKPWRASGNRRWHAGYAATLAGVRGNTGGILAPGGRRTGNTSVGVRCHQPKPWSIYVPVNVKIHATVLTASRTLRRGDVVSAEDFQLAERDVTALPEGHFSTPNRLWAG